VIHERQDVIHELQCMAFAQRDFAFGAVGAPGLL